MVRQLQHASTAVARRMMMAMVMVGMVMGAEGRKCSRDVFDNGYDFDSATIPSDCTELDLYMNSVGDVGAAALAKALEINPAITTLSLSNNDITDVGAAALAEALKAKNTALTTLDLSENKISDVGAAALAEALKTKNTALTTLSLESNFNIRDSTILASIQTSLAENKVNTKDEF